MRLAQAGGEIDYATGFASWFTGETERIRGVLFTAVPPESRTFTIKQPIGVAISLLPWNVPVALLVRKEGAALAATCTMIVKPSPETPISTLALADLAEQAGFGRGVFNVMTTDLENTPNLSEALCKHPLIKEVTSTGSVSGLIYLP